MLETIVEISDAFNDRSIASMGHLRCLAKAIDRTQRLLTQDKASRDYDNIHSTKSILYAAIEQMGMRAERFLTVQRMLRELLSIITTQYNSLGHDKQVGLQILDELKKRFPSLV